MSKKLLLIKQTDKDLYFSRNASNGNAKWTNSENMAYSYEPNEIQKMLERVEAETGIDCEIFEYNYQSFINGTTMITANNYFEEIKPIVSKLPAEVKEAHELVTAMLNDGIENPFNTGDKDIDEMGELLLKKANEILSASATKSDTPKAEPKPKATAKKVVKVAKVAKTPAKKTTKKAPAVRNTKAKGASPLKTKRKAAKKTAKLVKKVVANVRKADKAKPAVTKTIFSKELELIKQFISINGKTIIRQTLQTKHNAIANALKEGKVTMHIAHLKNILSRYNRVLSNLAPDTTEVRGSIEKGFLTTLKNVVAGAKIKVRTDVLGGTEKSDIEKVFEKYRYTGISNFAYDYATFMYLNDQLIDWFQNEYDEDGELIYSDLDEFDKTQIVADQLDNDYFDKDSRDSEFPTLEFFENTFYKGRFQGYELTEFLEHIGLSGVKSLSGVNDTITCSKCGWSWDKNQTTKNEMYKCHHCGHDSSPKK